MNYKRFRSRKLLLIITFLLDIHSISLYKLKDFGVPDVKEAPHQSSTRHSDVLWVVDEKSGRCLSPHSGGFDECSDLNIWIWTPLDSPLIGPKKLEEISETPDDNVEEGILQAASLDRKNNCLGRDRWRDRPAIKSCTINPLSPSIWKYNSDTGKLYSSGVISAHFGTTCIVERFDYRDGSTVGLGSCSKVNFLPLRFVHLHPDGSANSKYEALKHFEKFDDSHATSVVVSILATNATDKAVAVFKCPTTKLPFPLQLHDRHNDGLNTTRRNFQTFAGVGHYTKTVYGMKFNIYSMAWYVDAAAARQEPLLQPFQSMSVAELQQSTDFYRVVSTEGSFDRTLMLKLAMTLKKDLLIQGLVEELPLKPRNSKLLYDASDKYAPAECAEGLEIVITLRHANSSSMPKSCYATESAALDDVTVPFCGAANACPSSDYVEIQMGDMCVSINEPGLGADFFYNFFRKEFPVSDSARLSMVRGFPQIFDPTSLVPDAETISEPTSVHEMNSGSLHSQVSDFSKLLSIARSTIRYAWSLRWRRSRDSSSFITSSSSLRPSLSSSSSVAGFAARVSHRWQVNFHHLLLKKQRFYKLSSSEVIPTICIILYLTLLILLSLPPALLRKGIQKGVQLKKKCGTAIQRTFSRTQSLAKLTGPASADFKMIYFK